MASRLRPRSNRLRQGLIRLTPRSNGLGLCLNMGLVTERISRNPAL